MSYNFQAAFDAASKQRKRITDIKPPDKQTGGLDALKKSKNGRIYKDSAKEQDFFEALRASLGKDESGRVSPSKTAKKPYRPPQEKRGEKRPQIAPVKRFVFFIKILKNGALSVLRLALSVKEFLGGISFLRHAFKPKKIFLLVFGIILLSLGIAGASALPRVTVVIHPVLHSQSFTAEFRGLVDSSVRNLSLGIIPAEVFSFRQESSLSFRATGKEDRLEKARGTITVYNSYSSASQILVKNTRFIADTGHLFRTLEQITVPGAKVVDGKIIPSTKNVEVLAAEPGPDYNISPSAFSIPGFAGTPKFLGFYGKSKTSMAGGFVGEVTVVSADDIERAREDMKAELLEKIGGDISSKIPAGLRILDETRKDDFTPFSFSKKADEAADSFTASGAIKTMIFLISENELNGFIDEAISRNLEGGMIEVRRARGVEFSVGSRDFDSGEVVISADVRTGAYSAIDKEALSRALTGKNEQGVSSELGAMPEIRSAQVSFWPIWVRRVPGDISRVTLDIQPIID